MRNSNCSACSMLAQGVKFRRTPPHTCIKKNTDNHQWIKNELFAVQKTGVRGYKTTEQHTCKVCGCCRELTTGPKKYSNYNYDRSGILFGSRPECIDWSDREGLNNINQ